MSRGDQLQRQWNLLRTLQTRGEGIPLQDLARELKVVERTVQRDLELLQELGFPIAYESDEIGKRYWRMPHDFFRTGPLVLSLIEAISLHLARHLNRPLSGTLFAEGLDSLLAKVRSILPAKALGHFAGMEEVILVRSMGSVDYSDKADILSVLFEAARSNRCVEIGYHSVWRRKEYVTRIDPYGIVIFEDGLFVVAHSQRADALRVFKIARIESAAMTSDSFVRPEDFRLERTFRDTFGIVQTAGEPIEIVVKFDGPMAALVEEREWHESQQLAWLTADNSLFESSPEEPETLHATFRLTNVVEFKRWIKSFGEHAEVLRPASLRAELREEHLAAAKRYDHA